MLLTWTRQKFLKRQYRRLWSRQFLSQTVRLAAQSCEEKYMKSRQIGFGHAPENPNRTWEREINGRRFIFTKTREKIGVFLYGCKRPNKGDPETGLETAFFSDSDLTPDEVEQAGQFAAFIAGEI
jgi:hypothetical protein